MRRRPLSAPLSASREILRRSLLHASASGPKRPEKQDPWHISCNSCILALHLSKYRAGSAFSWPGFFCCHVHFKAGVERDWESARFVQLSWGANHATHSLANENPYSERSSSNRAPGETSRIVLLSRLCVL
jgi:hypothetical protein